MSCDRRFQRSAAEESARRSFGGMGGAVAAVAALAAMALPAASAPAARAAAAAPAPGLGPGRGPWRAEPAERHGLSTAGLAKAAALVQEMAPERHCFLVVKDGVVVHETYYGNSTPTSRYESDSLGKQGTALLMALGATKVRAPAVLPRMAEPAALG